VGATIFVGHPSAVGVVQYELRLSFNIDTPFILSSLSFVKRENDFNDQNGGSFSVFRFPFSVSSFPFFRFRWGLIV
jgi:hypothetical protein